MPNTDKISGGPALYRSMRLKVVIAATLLTLTSLFFNGYLTTATLEKIHVDSAVSSYRISGENMKQNLEKALRYGKKIDKFIGMDLLLESTLKDLNRTTSVSDLSMDSGKYQIRPNLVGVALPDGTLKYATPGLPKNTILPKEMVDQPLPSFFKYKGFYLIPLTVMGKDKEVMATVVLGFDQKRIKILLNQIRFKHLVAGLLSLAACMSFLFLAMSFVIPPRGVKNSEAKASAEFLLRRISWKRMSAIIVVILVSCQIIFSIYSIQSFNRYYRAINLEKGQLLNDLLKTKIEYLLSRGLKVEKLYKAESLLAEMRDTSPEVSGIYIKNLEGSVLYASWEAPATELTAETAILELPASGALPDCDVDTEIMSKDKVTPAGYLCLSLSEKLIRDRIKEIIFDSLTVLAIAILFSIELMILLFQMIQKTVDKSINGKPIAHYADIRPAAFLFSFGMDVCVSFLPLQMESLYQPLLGLSKDMVIGLPISVEMFFEGIAILLAGAWMDRKGWKMPFITGLFLTTIGTLYSWLAPNGLHLILSRGITGMGYGYVVISAQGFSVFSAGEGNKSKALTQIFAGLFAGSICGGAAGAMLAERFGYSKVFLIGAIVILLALIYTLIYTRMVSTDVTEGGVALEGKKPAQKVSFRDIIRFLSNKEIFSVIFLVGIPASIALVGYLYYYCPIYLKRIGVSQSNIGRIFIIHGVCLIYLAPLISEFVDRAKEMKSYLVYSGFAAGVGFAIYYLWSGGWATALVVFMLGISGCLMYASQNSYVLKQGITQNIGEGKAMGLISATGRIGQVTGPLLFAGFIAVGPEKGVMYFGLFYLICTLLFIALAKNDRFSTPTATEGH